MNSMEMVEQNLKTASDAFVGCLTGTEDAALIKQVKREIAQKSQGWLHRMQYCMPCPKGR